MILVLFSVLFIFFFCSFSSHYSKFDLKAFFLVFVVSPIKTPLFAYRSIIIHSLKYVIAFFITVYTANTLLSISFFLKSIFLGKNINIIIPPGFPLTSYLRQLSPSSYFSDFSSVLFLLTYIINVSSNQFI